MKKLTNALAAMLFCSFVMVLSSCTKQDEPSGGIANGSRQDKKIRALISRLPIQKLVHDRNAFIERNGGVNANRTDGWNFAFPGGGISFSNGTANVVTVTAGPTVINVSTSAFGANTGGGTVVAGQTSLDIDYTFCFSASDSNAVGLGLFDLGNGGFNGVSSVIGVSGDFEQLGEANDSTNFSDIFHGLAFYIVYDSDAQGTYEVINWLDDISDTTATDGNSFAFLFDFVNGRLFLSQDGSINVSTGTMNFQGNYLEVSGFLNTDGDLDLNGDLTYRTVPGFGAMGCN